MGALAGEPWRGAADIQLDHATGNRHAWAVLYTGSPPGEPTGNQTTWDGNPGDSFTIRVEWTGAALAANGQFTSIEVKTFLPGAGTQVGATWTISVNTDSGNAERTFHLDDDPLSNTAGTVRRGMVEIHLKVIRSGEPTGNYDADSRGTSNGLAIGTTYNWARGYSRASCILSSASFSNASLGGAEPSTWAYPDSVFNRLTLSAAAYRSTTATAKMRRAGSDFRSSSVAGTGATQDYTWSAASGTGAKILHDLATALHDFRLVLSSAETFGGSSDLEYQWAASGHASGFTRIDNSTLDKASAYNVDASLTITVQAEKDSTRTDGGNVTSYVISADELYLFAKVQNSRGELVTSQAVTHRLKRPNGTEASNAAGTTGADGWTAAANFTQFLTAPAGNWTQVAEADIRNAGTGTLDSAQQTLGFASAYTAHRSLVLHVADEAPVGEQVTLVTQYIQSDGTRLAFDSTPQLRVYSINSSTGAESDALAVGVMTSIGNNAYSRTWTPSGAGVFVAEVRGAYAGGGIMGAWHVTVRPRFDPTGLALHDILVSRM